ncbi:hypothetical protein KVR01_013180 [Diaporthe batatas]|uniref:uncharacterized protein n=1 Tax=Diaporthe batatas TaxID=748121 RepID=UPI001D053E48|nr:uncharacterized protein KVR01_013180 [Diaporthe batatas]KAG8156958.1 hypothetical protein KVR01_013180 [Diaporthe batatas]
MGITIHNNSAQNLDIWTSMAGPLQWNNNTPPGTSTVLDPGLVWVSVNAKVNTGSSDEIDTGTAIVSNLLPVVGFISVPAIGALVIAGMIAAKNNNIFSNTILPDKAKEYVDAGMVKVEDGVNMNIVDISGVYGRDNDVDVWGGEVSVEVKGDYLHITGFNPLQIKER